MPRIPRGQAAGYAYHVINRGNGRAQIFHKSQDYQAFIDLLAAARDGFGVTGCLWGQAELNLTQTSGSTRSL